MTPLIDDDDAMRWAEEFCRGFDGRTIVDFEPSNPKNRQIGPGTMVGWFANAMQTAIRQYRNRAIVTAQQADDGTISIVSDLPLDVLISSELLTTMIDQHNASIKRDPVDDSGHSDNPDDEAAEDLIDG